MAVDLDDKNVIVCPECATPMARLSLEDAADKTGALALYQCAGCSRKAGLILENAGGLSNAASSWVEDVLARTGHFFPSDFGPNASGRFGR